MTYYLMRFDDINPRMNWVKFNKLKKIINKYSINSILGVIPECEDKTISKHPENKDYLKQLKEMKSNGDLIAQHGYKHIMDSNNKGLFGNFERSEFAGLDYKTQYERIKKGKKILVNNEIWEPIFMAPAHSFDNTTLKALRKLNFELITDGFSRFPYRKNGIKFIPQLSSMPLPTYLPLISQLCIHVNTLDDKKLNYLINFIEKHNDLFLSPKEVLNFENNYLLYRLENKLIEFIIRLIRNIKKFL